MLSHIIRSREMRWLNNVIARFPEKPFLAIDSPQSPWIESWQLLTHAAYHSLGQESGTTTNTIDLLEETHQWIQEPNQHFVTKGVYLTSLPMHVVYTQCKLRKHIHVFGQKYLSAIIQKFCIPRTEFHSMKQLKTIKDVTLEASTTKKSTEYLK